IRCSAFTSQLYGREIVISCFSIIALVHEHFPKNVGCSSTVLFAFASLAFGSKLYRLRACTNRAVKVATISQNHTKHECCVSSKFFSFVRPANAPELNCLMKSLLCFLLVAVFF